MLNRTLALCLVLLAAACPAFCQLNADFGPNAGTDGDFLPAYNTNVTVDLSAAPTAAWDSAGTGAGVYDPTKWAVVFKYKSVNIPTYTTVTFKNNSAAAPVVWLVSGNVTINNAGTLDVSGHNSVSQGSNPLPGPGGFRGGAGLLSGSASGGGFGVGGGNNAVASAGSVYGSGSYATLGVSSGVPPGQSYGNPHILPLIGGAGGAGKANSGGDGGGGGGAILIIATGTITINGAIYANGGSRGYDYAGGGSGGAIRLVASSVSGTGVLRAVGGDGYYIGNGGDGRIRLETSLTNSSLTAVGNYSEAAPDSPVKIWPDTSAPTVRVVSVGSAVAPTDPHASLGAADVQFNTSAAQTVTLETTNVPPGGTVTLRVVPQHGAAFSVPATLLSGDITKATWTVAVIFPPNYCALQARAALP